MKIQELFEEGNPNNPGRAVLSFEVFPPKRDLPIESVYGQLSSLCALKPDFISVTYGAGGKGNDNRTAEIAARIKHNYGIESVAHLTCVSNTKEDVDRIAEELRINNIENILALRGDLPEGVERAEDFAHASDLTAYLAAKGGFDLAGACYPETHPEAANEIDDIRNLKQKVDAGSSTGSGTKRSWPVSKYPSKPASCRSYVNHRSSGWSPCAAPACRHPSSGS